MRYILVLFCTFITFSFAKATEISKCIPATGVGEAMITKGYPSAKSEAIMRAKWDAIEKALGTDIQVKDIVENFKLLDEVILKDIKGFIKDVKIVKEENFGNFIRVYIKTCVYPKEAEKTLALLTKETAISMLFVVEDNGQIYIDEINPLTTSLTKELLDQGFQIYDLSKSRKISLKSIKSSIDSRNFSYLENILKKSLSKALVIGKVSFTILSKSGQSIGYGIKSSLYSVRAYANYYIFINNKGYVKILASGIVSSKGFGLTEEEAKQKALLRLSEQLTNEIVYNLNKYMLFKHNVITLIVEDVYSVSENFEIKEKLQKLPWVKSVVDLGVGKFKVEYLENPVYLANALENNLNYKVKEFSPTKIVIELN
ncbi:MAG: hypothetical protein DSY47_08095 [Hydrogenothermus sp.]|nr:MAG: hypothetical protein DSY47_08095 [Hydrogenothermus sp.]